MRHTVVEELVDFAYPGFYTHLNLTALCGTISTVQLHLLLAVTSFVLFTNVLLLHLCVFCG